MKNISFIIPNYNGEKTIRKVIESILKQDYKKGKIEIIILDDKSKDNSIKILSQYKSTVTVKKRAHRYHFGNHINVQRSIVDEYLIIGE